MHSSLAQEIRGRHGGRPSILSVLLLGATLAFLWFILGRHLSLEWSSNEQYSYGWFVPFFAAFLFWLRFEDAPHLRSGSRLSVIGYASAPGTAIPPNNKEPITNNWLLTAAALLLAALLPIRLFELANPDWRPLSWAHALIVVGFSLLVIGYCGGKAAVRHFAFPVCFILVAVPWPSPIEAPLVLGLMRLVATVATETLTLFGIPAQLEGSLIRVNNGVVGVSEACSGVRSLQTSLMIGLLFGELKRLTIGRRFLLVGAALTIALLANFGRAVFLVWIAAAQDLAAVERWHDIAGYAIVGLVFLGTVVSAGALGKVENGKRTAESQVESEKAKVERLGKAESGKLTAKSPPNNQEPVTDAQQRPGFQITDNRSHKRPIIFLLGKPGRAFTCFVTATLAFLLCAEGAVSFWYRWHERNFVPTASWEVRWPEEARDFRDLPIAENIRSTLRYDAGREATWRLRLLPNEVDAPSQCTMFFFRWEAGSTSILRARAHRPDICLPNTGWRLTEDLGVREYAAAGGLSLPFRHFRFVRDAGAGLPVFADAFFCQREDRVPAARSDRFDATSGGTGHWEIADRLRVVREGLRNQGQQVLELVFISRQPLTAEQVESEFAGLVPRVVKAKAPGH